MNRGTLASSGVLKAIQFPSPRRTANGFSLIVSLVMMVLLTVLVTGLLGLAAIELRSSGRSSAMQEARANARLALILAIGELQQHAGPDRRVTGGSSFLGDPSSPDPAKAAAHPHWTAVWKSGMPDDQPVIRRNGQGGGLRDRRALEGWDARDDLLAQLVSGNEGGIRHTADGGGETGAGRYETLVGTGTLGSGGEAGNSTVSAPKVRVGDPAKPAGEYAWWVGDLGTKANVATPDRFAGRKDTEATVRRLQIAQDFSLAASPEAGDVDNASRERLASPAMIEVLDGKGPEGRGDRFHDFTTDSESVLSDVRDGGLKKDLTAYLLSNGSIAGLPSEGLSSLGVDDDDNLVGPANKQAAAQLADGGEAARLSEVSPSFGLLRDWARRAVTTPFTASAMKPEFPPVRARDENKQASYGDHNYLPVQFENRTKSDVTPVLADASLYYNLSHYESGDADPRRRHGLRLHLYPRVVLWNPYNMAINLGPSMVAMQINGAKQIEVTLKNKRTQAFRMSWGRLQDERGQWSRSRRGTHYFRLDGTTLAPGETVVFAPASNRPYDENLFSNNLLTSEVPPDPTRSFFQDKRADGDPLFRVQQSFPPNPAIADNRLLDIPLEWREFVTTRPNGNIQVAEYTQADDYFMYWKPITGNSGAIDLRAFNRLPHGRYVSCAFQYGDEDELPVQWSSRDPVPFQQSDATGITRQIPDRRTRDGFRLRWFQEHPSNIGGSGSLGGTPHFDSAPIANWNMRAAYSFRSPFENVTDIAPHFFGIYTRDLFDEAVGWSELTPRAESGRQLGDPFEQPVAGVRRILFDVPRNGAEVVSLGAFQHLKFSEFIWHPTYAFGNSLADPRVKLSMTEPDRGIDINARDGGWNRDAIGYATDGRSNNDNGQTSNADNWAYHARGLLEQVVYEQNVIFDLSYELNHSLWDRYFLSTGDPQDKIAFAKEPHKHPLPNGRLRPGGKTDEREDKLLDFHRAASVLTLDGGFNVNSTSPQAWEALLLSSLGVKTDGDKVSFPRIFNLPGGTWDGSDPTGKEAWTGQRELSRGEVRQLAEAIAGEVRRRGPFLSLADFVNRRLREDETGKMGTLEAALLSSGINRQFIETWPLDNRKSLPDYRHPDNIKDPTRIEQTAKPDSAAWGALGYLTQGDLLQSLGPVLTARSDTFVVRAYGSSLDKDGKAVAEAWCEAIVQRTPEPLAPDETGLNPRTDLPVDFGRKFTVKRFRWLHRDEI
jgi:hypothetical protein